MDPEALQDTVQPLSQHVERVLVRNKVRFLSFLERRLGSRALAEEALQSAFVKALETTGPALDEQGAVRWLFRVLRNALLDATRREAVGRRALETIAHEEQQSIDPEAHETICVCLDDVISTLRPEYAASVRAVDLKGTSVGEFARDAGITPNNASVRLHRARAALRAQLIRSCGACAAHACLDDLPPNTKRLGLPVRSYS
jgi:RNA polymerase sigma-70 factor (ECF subfamily)